MRGWLGEVLFVVGFVAFLWLMRPPEDLKPRYGPQPEQPSPFESPLDSLLKSLLNETGSPRTVLYSVRWLPVPSPADPVIEIDVSKRHPGNKTGTVFAIGDGLWGTARHVVEGCGRVFVSVAGNWVPAQQVRVHTGADVAVLATPGPTPALPISDRLLRIGEPGLHVGFPQSKPASVRSEVIGRVRVKWPNFEGYERGITWAELERVPEFDGPLGGISGSPVLDEYGRVVGVTTSASARRGRVHTSAIENLREIAPPQRRTPLPLAQRLKPDNLPAEATRLRSTDMVTQAYCTLDPLASAPRRPRARG